MDLRLGDGRTLHVYEPIGPDDGLPVCWHHGTPNLGAPPVPLYDAAARLGLRWFGYDRPGYGGSSPRVDRTIGSAAEEMAAVADALGIGRFAVMGHSGGGPHALAGAALLGDRVPAAVSVAGVAPYDADGLDWFAGMADAGVQSNQAAAQGREVREALVEDDDADFGFTSGDEEALGGRWAWFLDVVRPALGASGAIDDDLAATSAWGFDPAAIAVPLLLLHGDADRVVPVTHGRWLAEHVPGAELRVTGGDGHITVMDHAEAALEWLSRAAT
jgi:pimeloyl-ACP methyl ester carboxylesterase